MISTAITIHSLFQDPTNGESFPTLNVLLTCSRPCCDSWPSVHTVRITPSTTSASANVASTAMVQLFRWLVRESTHRPQTQLSRNHNNGTSTRSWPCWMVSVSVALDNTTGVSNVRWGSAGATSDRTGVVIAVGRIIGLAATTSWTTLGSAEKLRITKSVFLAHGERSTLEECPAAGDGRVSDGNTVCFAKWHSSFLELMIWKKKIKN